MFGLLLSVNLFHDVTGNVRSRLKVDLSEGGITKRPQLFKLFGSKNSTANIRPLPKLLIRKIEVEYAGMEVRSAKIFAIFSCHIKTDRILTLYGVNASVRLSKALHELLKMIIMQTLVCRQVLIVIRQSNKTIVCIPTCLMQTPTRPLARTLQPTSYALTAWQREAAHNIVPGALIENNVPCCRFPRR
jgi:hypothetical protein